MQYKIHDTLVLRTPRFGLNKIFDNPSLENIITDEIFVEGIYFSSSDLYDAVNRVSWDRNKKLQTSLYKYLFRSAFRCTPFGLQAGISTAQFGSATKIILNREKRHARLDSDVVYKIASELENILPKRNLIYYSNNTIYKIGKTVRFYEVTKINDKRFYKLSEVRSSKILNELIQFCNQGQTGIAIEQFIRKENYTKKETEDYITQLIQNQIIICGLYPDFKNHNVNDFLQIINKPASKKAKRFKEVLSLISEELSEMNGAQEKSSIHSAEKIYNLLEQINITPRKSWVSHIDLKKETFDATLDVKFKTELSKAIDFLFKIAPKNQTTPLKIFAKRFSERYENRMIDLTEAIDPDIGLGYGNEIEPKSSLTAEISIGNKSPEINITFDKITQWLYDKLQRALLEGSHEIDLATNETPAIIHDGNHLGQTSFSVMFRVTNFAKKEILIESAGGSNGIKLIGRFANLDEQISKVIQDILHATKEEETNKVIAEIIHIPEDRLRNVLMHPKLFDYEIPILTNTAINFTNKILISDLSVCVRQGLIQLFSKKHKKEVIPILCNAHNYQLSELPIYRFLCDVESQHCIPSFTFTWRGLEHVSSFLPRVKCGTVILAPATWNIKHDDIKELASISSGEIENKFDSFKKKYKVPNQVLLIDDDNELFIDFTNLHSRQIFIDSIKGKQSISLKESLYDSRSSVIDKNGHHYNNQFIATFIKSTNKRKDEKIDIGVLKSETVKERRFIPGSKWIYYKYYCSPAKMNDILLRFVAPLAKQLLKKNIISLWHFVRFKDEYHHLRIRFCLKSPKNWSNFISIHEALASKISEAKYIWKFQIDTYNRELERYGYDLIDVCEEIFFHDSIAVMKNLEQVRHHDNGWLCGISFIDELLTYLGLTITEKFSLLDQLKESYFSEFNIAKPEIIKLDEKYRNEKVNIDNSIKERTAFSRSLRSILKANNFDLFKLKGVAPSLIHMHINRLIKSNQRIHELAIYYFLFKYYQSAIAIELRL